ncbi:hypothetical protein PZA11_000867 [Diplocarpon coronariae]
MSRRSPFRRLLGTRAKRPTQISGSSNARKSQLIELCRDDRQSNGRRIKSNGPRSRPTPVALHRIPRVDSAFSRSWACWRGLTPVAISSLPESSLLAPRLPHRPSDLSPDTFGTMHVAFLAALLASFAQAALLDSRRKCAVGAVENEYTLGGCRPILFFYARGSSEAGNMGNASYSPGPPTAQGLKNIFGCREVAVEGVDYAALLASNWLPGGTDPGEARELHDLFVDAATRCPRSILLGGGYRYATQPMSKARCHRILCPLRRTRPSPSRLTLHSQGAALTHRAVEKLPAWVRARIAAIVLYGDTQNLKDSGRIPNFPEARTLIICNPGDVICAGNLTITYAHIEYVPRVPEALSFYTRAALRTHH